MNNPADPRRGEAARDDAELRPTTLSQIVRVGAGLLGGVIFAAGVGAAFVGVPIAALYGIVSGAVLITVAVYEHGRYRARLEGARRTTPQLERTDEVFLDPTTGQQLRVWYDRASGERRYMPDA